MENNNIVNTNFVVNTPERNFFNSTKLKLKHFFNHLRTKSKTIFSVFLVLVLTVSTIIGSSMIKEKQTMETQASGAELSFSPSTTNLTVGDIFSVAIVIDTKGLNASAADIDVTYETTKLEAQNIQPMGDMLPITLKEGTINKSDGSAIGHAKIVLGAKVDQTKAYTKSGIGVLAQINFKVLAGGATVLKFDPLTVVVASGQPSNIISLTTPLSINPTTPPTETPISISTPTPTEYKYIKRGDTAIYLVEKFGMQIYVNTSPSFADVSLNTPYYQAVETFYKNKITTGCNVNPLRFCPERELTRSDAVTFLIRIAGFSPDETDTVPIFADVPQTHPLFKYVQLFGKMGFTSGCSQNPAKFCPDDSITKAELDTFISRVKTKMGI